MDMDTMDFDFSWDESFDKEIFNEQPKEEEQKKEEASVISNGEELSDEEFLTVEEEEEEPATVSKKESSETTATTTEDDSSNEDKEEQETEDEKEDSEILTSLFNDLKENGILTIDLDADEKLDSTMFLEKFEQELDKRVEEEIVAFASDFDEEAKAFIEFKKNGGSTVDFLKLYLNESELPVTSVETVNEQEAFLRYYLKNYEDMEYEEIDEELELYKERNQLEKKATKAFQKITAQIEQQKQTVLQQQKTLKETDEKNKYEFIKKLDGTLKASTTIGEFNVTNEDKKELVNFIVKPTVAQGTRKVTGMQSKINEIYRDPEKLLLFAKLIKNDFDLSDLVKKVETKVTKKALEVVTSKKKTVVPKVSTKGKYLADFFQ